MMMCVTGSQQNGTIATTETATPLSQHKPIRVGGCGYFYRSGSQAPQESYSLNAPLTPHAGSRSINTATLLYKVCLDRSCKTDGYYAQHKTMMMCVTGSKQNGTIA